MRNFALLFLMILLAGMPACKSSKSKKAAEAAAIASWQAKQDSIRVADSLKKISLLEEARLDSIRRAEEERMALASRYNIIVGAFLTPEYAQAWADEYLSRGYNPVILQMEGSRFGLVSAEAHEKIGNAIRRLNEFQDTEQVDAWIYRKN